MYKTFSSIGEDDKLEVCEPHFQRFIEGRGVTKAQRKEEEGKCNSAVRDVSDLIRWFIKYTSTSAVMHNAKSVGRQSDSGLGIVPDSQA